MTKITNLKEFFGWTGLILATTGLLAYLILLVDLLLFKLDPWPSRTGELVERRITITQSYFWIQFMDYYDQIFIPTLLGVIVWKFGGLIIGIGIGLFLRSFHELTDPNNNKNLFMIFRDITTQEKKKFVISILGFLVLTCSVLYYTYAHKFEEKYNSDSHNPLLEFNPLDLTSEPFLFYILIFILLPVLYFYLGYKLIISKNIWINLGCLSILFFCILLDIYLYIIFRVTLISPV